MLIDLEQIQHKHLAERVYEEVRDRILRRALTTDEQIPVDQIAAELDVSRTPVLDAVKRLAAEGLVEVRARRGSFVRGLTDTDVREIFQIREAIEVFGVRNAIAEGRHAALAEALEGWIFRMDATVAGGAYRDYLSFSEADRGFHQAIVASCGNGRMAEMYATLSVHVHIMRVHLLRAIEGPDRIQAQHTALAEAVRAADVDGAQAAVITHLSTVRDRMVVRIADHGGSL